MTEMLIRTQRLTVDQLIEAVLRRDPEMVSQVLNPLDRRELEAVAIILADHVDPEQARILSVIRMSAKTFKITREAITSAARDTASVDARAVAVYALRLFDLSYKRIGDVLGGRDHTTMINAAARAGESPRLRGIATAIAIELGWERPQDGAA